jgi:hypothetical protein
MLTIFTCNMQGFGDFQDKWKKLIYFNADIKLIQECGINVPSGTYEVDEEKSANTKINGVLYYKPSRSTDGLSRNTDNSRVKMIQFAIWDEKLLDSYENQLSFKNMELDVAEKKLKNLKCDHEKKEEKIKEMTYKVNRLQEEYENATKSLDLLSKITGLSAEDTVLRLAEIQHSSALKSNVEKNLKRSRNSLDELKKPPEELKIAVREVGFLQVARDEILRKLVVSKTAHDKDGNYRGSRCNSAIWTKLLPETFDFSPDPINPDEEYRASHRRILYGTYSWKSAGKEIVLLIFNIHAPASYLAYTYFEYMVDRFEELLAANSDAHGWICAGDFNIDANKMKQKFDGRTTPTKSALVMSDLMIFASTEVTHLSVPQDEGGNKMTQSELVMFGEKSGGNRLDYMVLRIKGKVNKKKLPDKTVVPSRMHLVVSDHFSVLFEINLEKLFQFIKISNEEDSAMVVEC